MIYSEHSVIPPFFARVPAHFSLTRDEKIIETHLKAQAAFEFKQALQQSQVAFDPEQYEVWLL